jgi:hypothetical protein
MTTQRGGAQHEHHRGGGPISQEERAPAGRAPVVTKGVIREEEEWSQDRALFRQDSGEVERDGHERPLASMGQPRAEHEKHREQLRAPRDVRDDLGVDGQRREEQAAEKRRPVARSRVTERQPGQGRDTSMEQDVDEMKAERAGPPECAVDRKRGHRQRAVKTVVLARDAPVRKREQAEHPRQGGDVRVVLDELDVVEHETVPERAHVHENGDEGGDKRPPRRRPRGHQKAYA